MLNGEKKSSLLSHNVKIREKAQSHHATDPPICSECQDLDLVFFDPTCVTCSEILSSPRTSVSEIFAIIRQWVPQTQQHIDVLISEILQRGCNIDDNDGLTDMNMLHYTAKSGALGVGDAQVSCKVVKILLERGINIYTKCKWTDMSALHYAVFFDIPSIVEILLEASNSQDIDRSCKEFDNGSSLHIGCSNLAFNSIQVLLKHGANPHQTNKYGKLPIQCLPSDLVENSIEYELVEELKKILLSAMDISKCNQKHNLSLSTLRALGLELHDKVVVSGKVGILRFCGSTDFASGQWAGIELIDPIGKNNGSVAGVKYFSCKPSYGIFSPLTKIKKYEVSHHHADIVSSSDSSFSSVDESRCSSSLSETNKLMLGERVVVADQKVGCVKYIGPTKFATGCWVGVELESMCGKNNGTVAGVKYFECQPKHGVFAPFAKVKKVADDDTVSIDNTVFRSKIPTSKNKLSTLCNTLSQPRKAAKLDKTLGAQLNFTLKNGMSVYTSGELGIVRFIGPVHFASDVWLGIELRKPSGKNDGTVEGQKYFSCKPKHGLMVRPNRTTCRGINCAQLIDLQFSEQLRVS